MSVAVLKQELITQIDGIFSGLPEAAFYRTRNHKFENGVAVAVSNYTETRLAQYDTQIISIERRRIALLEQRVTTLERRITSLEQRIARL